jgi:hypothetical protein
VPPSSFLLVPLRFRYGVSPTGSVPEWDIFNVGPGTYAHIFGHSCTHFRPSRPDSASTAPDCGPRTSKSAKANSHSLISICLRQQNASATRVAALKAWTHGFREKFQMSAWSVDRWIESAACYYPSLLTDPHVPYDGNPCKRADVRETCLFNHRSFSVDRDVLESTCTFQPGKNIQRVFSSQELHWVVYHIRTCMIFLQDWICY